MSVEAEGASGFAGILKMLPKSIVGVAGFFMKGLPILIVLGNWLLVRPSPPQDIVISPTIKGGFDWALLCAVLFAFLLSYRLRRIVDRSRISNPLLELEKFRSTYRRHHLYGTIGVFIVLFIVTNPYQQNYFDLVVVQPYFVLIYLLSLAFSYMILFIFFCRFVLQRYVRITIQYPFVRYFFSIRFLPGDYGSVFGRGDVA